jgi:hypothetical protein
VEDRIHSSAHLDDTSRCPLGHRCESCGAERDDLTVSAATTPLGVLCLTLCPQCDAFDEMPRVAVGTAARLVMQHCMHLGITVDDMEAALEAEQ